jgi:hypothetical protein
VSQVIPFLYPMADRYLYGILPGLLGGAALGAREAWPRLAPRLPEGLRSALAGRGIPAPRAVALLVAAALLVALGSRSETRTWVYRTETNLRRDAAAKFPYGLQAQMLRAERAAAAGDVVEVAEGLRAAHERGFTAFLTLVDGPPESIAAYRNRREVAAVIQEMALWWIERLERISRPTQIDLYMAGRAHEVRGEREEAMRTLERALALGGPHDEVLRRHLARLGAHPSDGPGVPGEGRLRHSP